MGNHQNFFKGLKELNVVIVGSGIAGLSTAYYLDKSIKAVVISKASLSKTASWVAQGGIAVSISEKDTTESHFKDTIVAGDGLCNEKAVKVLVEEGKERMVDMIKLGVPFDRTDKGFDYAREGGHSFSRILHYGDKTGAAITETLFKVLSERKNVKFFNNIFVKDILIENGRVSGLSLIVDGKNYFMSCSSVVLAAGGAGQVYKMTTNPESATGDGIGISFRAGAEICDMEFFQFHPTVLKDYSSPKVLITEAVRGRGAKLRDCEGSPIMEGVHPLKDLAPRFVIVERMAELIYKKGIKDFYLDLTMLSEDDWKNFPNLRKELLKRGFSPGKEWIPIFPAAHYLIGGVKTNLYGKTSLDGLYACGEVSSTGVHGANRLASNSLLEGLVFGKRIADSISSDRIEWQKSPSYSPEEAGGDLIKREEFKKLYYEIKDLMWEKVGILKNEKKLREALDYLEKTLRVLQEKRLHTKKDYELLNMVTTALLICKFSKERRESRGVHLNSDYPRKNDKHYLSHFCFSKRELFKK